MQKKKNRVLALPDILHNVNMTKTSVNVIAG